MLTVAISGFYKYKALDNLVSVFALPVYLILAVSFNFYTVALVGESAAASLEWRVFLIAAEIALGLAIPLTKYAERAGSGSPRDAIPALPSGRSELLALALSLPAILVAIMPCFVPLAIIGDIGYGIRLYDLTEAHRIMIYMAFILPVIVYHFTKDKPEDVKRFLMIFASLAFLWAYLGRWNLQMLKDPYDWPLHLCNTAMFLVPICLIFRIEKLFNFCLFINVAGSLMAMILPGELSSITAIGTERVSFWLNHWAAFGMPLLAISLKNFPRPKFKEWVYAVIELCVYYFSMLFTNAYLTAKYGREADFFFTNSDFITSSLGAWAETMHLHH